VNRGGVDYFKLRVTICWKDSPLLGVVSRMGTLDPPLLLTNDCLVKLNTAQSKQVHPSTFLLTILKQLVKPREIPLCRVYIFGVFRLETLGK
jgi:hypothetical protein